MGSQRKPAPRAACACDLVLLLLLLLLLLLIWTRCILRGLLWQRARSERFL